MHPLDDVVIVDASQALVGPLATQVFGDLGADIIKVEQPEYGDLTRHYAPKYGEISSYFVSLNRNKRSITVDLKSDQGQQILHDIIADADVFLQNFSPGKAEDFAMDRETLTDINDSLIYCDISGYGHDSPYSDRKSFDIVLQGESGLMSITGTDDGKPVRVGISICDISAAMTSTYAVLSALYHRAHTGEGEYIDISLLDTSFQFLLYNVTNYFATGENPKQMGTKHPNLSPYQALETADSYIVVGVVSEKFWPPFCEAIGREEWTDDPRFATFDDRVANREAFDELLDDVFRQKTTDEWIEILREHDIPSTPINSVSDIVENPHIEAREMVAEMEHEELGTFKTPGNPVNFDSLDVSIRRAPPKLGEHTTEILAEQGYSPEEIARFEQNDIV